MGRWIPSDIITLFVSFQMGKLNRKSHNWRQMRYDQRSSLFTEERANAQQTLCWKYARVLRGTLARFFIELSRVASNRWLEAFNQDQSSHKDQKGQRKTVQGTSWNSKWILSKRLIFSSLFVLHLNWLQGPREFFLDQSERAVERNHNNRSDPVFLSNLN